MEAPVRQQSFNRKKMTKQLTSKRDDTPLHLAARSGNLELIVEIISQKENAELKELLCKQNHAGETALYVAVECGYADLVKALMKYYDSGMAAIKAKNGYDAFHIASKKGNLEVLKVLMEAIPELSMTVDLSNTTVLHTAAAQGHVEVVNFLLENVCSLATIARNNGKTALHSAARNGHLMVVKALLSKEPGITVRNDKKGQTALHMAVKGQNVDLVDEILGSDPSLINMVDNKGNTVLHMASRKGRTQIVEKLLNYPGLDAVTINKSGETAFDSAEKTGNLVIAAILSSHGVQSAKSIKPPVTNRNKEIKETVIDIKHKVHNQLEHTHQTRKRVRGIAKRLNKMHSEGLNNAINSTTVVAVLIATVAYAAIFTVPGQFAELDHLPSPSNSPGEATDHLPSPSYSPGEANIAPQTEFIIFIIFDSFALFISLAVVIVQTSVVVSESKAKKQLMAVINKLMWLACVLISVAFLSLSYTVVGDDNRWLAILVTGIGTLIMATTLGTMCYWVVLYRINASKIRSSRRSSMSSVSRSWSMSMMSDSEILSNEYRTVYAI